jgi:hypothetical protein
MDSNSLSQSPDGSSEENLDIVEIRWAQLDETAELYAGRSVCQADTFDS